MVQPATTAPGTSPAAELSRMLGGFQLTQILCVAATLGIADLLAEGPRSAEELAAATDTHAPSLYRLLRALAGHGVFAEDEVGRFALTPLAEPLRADVPGSLRLRAEAIVDQFYRVWGDLLYSVRTGKTAFEHVFGMTNWQYRAEHPEANAQFNQLIATFARQRGRAVAEAYRFPEGATIVDVGGGNGTLLTYILGSDSSLYGVLADQPHVVAEAPATLEAAGVMDRCRIEAIDFFEAVPPGGDIYVMSLILHDWGDRDALRILDQCREAMGPGSTLLLIEAVVPPGNAPSPSKMSDIGMLLVNVGGRERTEAEWRTLLEQAGFALTRVIDVDASASLIEAHPRPNGG